MFPRLTFRVSRKKGDGLTTIVPNIPGVKVVKLVTDPASDEWEEIIIL